MLGRPTVVLQADDQNSADIAGAIARALIVDLANASTDLQNCIKQSAEFGIIRAPAHATLLMQDVISVGKDVCQGLLLANSFYWIFLTSSKARSRRRLSSSGN